MARKTRAQARADNAKARAKVDAAKAKGHLMDDLVHEDGLGWSTTCRCGWESGWRRSTRVLSGVIAMHLAVALQSAPAGDPVPNAYDGHGSPDLRDPAELLTADNELALD